MSAFAVIYRGYLKPHTENEYKQAWKTVATYFVEHKGALGSCLHKTEEGMWVAYSRWFSKEKWEAAWGSHDKETCFALFPLEIQQAIKTIKECLDETRKFPEILMEVQEDLL